MRFSASSLPLLVDCAYSAKPGVPLAKDKPNDAMYVGNAVHKLAEWYLTGQPCDVVQACAAEKAKDVDRVSRLWATLGEWLPGRFGEGTLSEAAYAYCPMTDSGRLLGFGIGRQYRQHGQTEDELAGTADMVVFGDDAVVVYDFKTGRSSADSYRWQLRLLGLAAARHHRRSRAVVRVIKVGETEIDDSWEEVLDASDLDDVREEAVRVWLEVPIAEAKPGNWCESHYCRAREKCAGYRAWRQ